MSDRLITLGESFCIRVGKPAIIEGNGKRGITIHLPPWEPKPDQLEGWERIQADPIGIARSITEMSPDAVREGVKEVAFSVRAVARAVALSIGEGSEIPEEDARTVCDAVSVLAAAGSVRS